LNALQQATLKRPATHGTLIVNPAKRAIKTGARLRKSLLAAFFHQGQPKFSQPFGVIAIAQFHVGKQNAVAAQPALWTELFNAVHTMNGSSRCASAPRQVFKIRWVAQASGLLFRASRPKPL
jgi:cell wall assembly regulator SMI1